ncbi:hypothetical protein D3C75_1043870 [compost metagenome]
MGVFFVDIIHQQVVEAVHFHIGDILGYLHQQFHTLLHGEQGGFAGVVEHRHNHLIEYFRRPVDNVQMPVSHRIKASRTDSNGWFMLQTFHFSIHSFFHRRISI